MLQVGNNGVGSGWLQLQSTLVDDFLKAGAQDGMDASCRGDDAGGNIGEEVFRFDVGGR
jgi:hypothetical protein